jgi:hypothetical protein
MAKQILQHPLRSMGAAFTVAGAAVVFVVLILPALAAGGTPSGKYAVKRFLNQKGQSTQKVSVTNWFYLKGKSLDDANQVYCWENGALTTDSSEPKNGHWTFVSSWTVVSPRLITVDLNDKCAGVHGKVISVQFNGDDGVAGDPIGGDNPSGDPGDDVLIVGPPVAMIGFGL